MLSMIEFWADGFDFSSSGEQAEYQEGQASDQYGPEWESGTEPGPEWDADAQPGPEWNAGGYDDAWY